MAYRIDLLTIAHTDTDGEEVGIMVCEADTLEEAWSVYRNPDLHKHKIAVKRVEAYERGVRLPPHLSASRPPCIAVYYPAIARE